MFITALEQHVNLETHSRDTYDDGTVELVDIRYRLKSPEGHEMQCVGPKGETLAIPGPYIDLGIGKRRCKKPFGLRRALWDFCYGYVSGFPVHAIFYYIWTRSLSEKRYRRIVGD